MNRVSWPILNGCCSVLRAFWEAPGGSKYSHKPDVLFNAFDLPWLSFFVPKSIFFLVVHETETAHLLPLSVVLFCRSVLSNCVRSYTTSKRIELESPTRSQISDNFKSFPTVICLLIFQCSPGKQCCKTLVLFFPFSFFATQDWLLVIVPPTYCAFRPRIGVTFYMSSVLFISLVYISFWAAAL